MQPERRASLASEGVILLEFAMVICRLQQHFNRDYLFEHPSTALSWCQPCVQSAQDSPLKAIRREHTL
eukprot:6490693-Amphidinium_carterae.3